MDVERKREAIDFGSGVLSVTRQCELLGLCRSSLYYQPVPEDEENIRLMNLIDQEFMDHPFYGRRRICRVLQDRGEEVNEKRVRRLMRLMGLEAVYPKPRLSRPEKWSEKYPYLLRGLAINRADQVWAADITYIRLYKGFGYLVAIMDWYSRCVLSWRLSNSLDVGFCLEALEEALQSSRPEIFNTDQGSQFTSADFLGSLKGADIRISLDGRGRAFDNIMVERLWRSVKYENVYLNDYNNLREAEKGLGSYFKFYNESRPHQSLGYKTPQACYRGRGAA